MGPERTNKIRILHIVQSLSVGGAETVLVHYIKALGTEHYEHMVYNVWQDGPVREKIEAMGVQVFSSPPKVSIINPIRFFVWFARLFTHLKKFIHQHEIDIIRSDLGFANQVAIFLGLKTGIPVFPTVHSTMAFVDRRASWDLRVYMNKILNHFLYPKATRIVAISEEVKEIIRRTFNLPYEKLVVVTNGIVFENSLSNTFNESDPFSGFERKLRIIGVGSLDHEKAFDVLIKAIDLVVQQGFKNMAVFIAGEGRERKKLEGLIANFKIEQFVFLLGIRNDVIQLLKSSDIFIIPSRYEGLSIAMIEAMACGLPIIASDSPGLRDYIKHEKNGLVFPADDHETLAKRIIAFYEDKELRTILSARSRSSFEERFNLKNNIKIMDTLFHEAIKKDFFTLGTLSDSGFNKPYSNKTL